MTTKGSRGTTFLHVRQAACDSPRAEVGCASSLNGQVPSVAQLELNFQVGIPYFIFVGSSGEPDVSHLNMQVGASLGSVDPDPDPDPDPTNACGVPHPGSPVDQSLVGDNKENQNNFSGSYGGAGSEDVVVLVPEESDVYCLNTMGSQIDTVVYVRAAICTDDSAEIGCAASREFTPNTSPADTGEPPGIARLNVMLEASNTYYIFVDALVGNRGGAVGIDCNLGTMQRCF